MKRRFPISLFYGLTSLVLTYLVCVPLGVLKAIKHRTPTDAAAGFNYGLDKVRFLAPVAAGARVRLRVTVDSIDEKKDGQILLKTRNVLEIENSDKPALIAEALALLIPGKKAK